jgi:hypothetical protein
MYPKNSSLQSNPAVGAFVNFFATNVKQITMKAHSAAEVSRHIAGKDDLYYATVRNGYYLPSLKSSIITEDYLADVACGRVL